MEKIMQTYITLNDKTKIPQFGLGVFMIQGNEKTKSACLEALKCGYRHIDTAHIYGNEKGVGEAIKESGIDRKEIWVTSKLWINEFGEEASAKGIDEMLKRLNLDYVDLVLLHQPRNDYKGAWKALEKAVNEGKVKSIGLSNFEDEKLEEMLEFSVIKPSVLQVECHPFFQQHALKKRLEAYDIKLESWYPLGHADKSLIDHPLFKELGQKYNKTAAQVILRWHIEEGNIVFPKSTNPQHIKENIDIFDFKLTKKELDEINKLDKEHRFFDSSFFGLLKFVLKTIFKK